MKAKQVVDKVIESMESKPKLWVVGEYTAMGPGGVQAWHANGWSMVHFHPTRRPAIGLWQKWRLWRAINALKARQIWGEL